MHNRSGASYDVALMRADLTARGWLPIDLARKAHVSHMTVGRFLSGERQTARTAKKLADALGRSLRRYLVSDTPAASTEPANTTDENQLVLPLRRATDRPSV